MVKYFYILIILSFVFRTASSSAQESIDQKLTNQQTRLERIRAEVLSFKKTLASKEAIERSTLDRLSEMDREIDLIRKLLLELKYEEEAKVQKIQQTRQELQKTKKSLTELQDLFSQRIVYIYKYGKLSDLELLLTAKSLNEAYVRYKYLQLIAEQDQRDIKSIFEKKRQIELKEEQLKIELAEHRKVIAEKEQEEKSFTKKIQDRKRYLTKIKKDKKILKAVIQEKEDAAAAILDLIAQLELERRRSLRKPYQPKGYSTFAQYKGNMNWPVEGKIINRFGQQKHPKLKTITNNTGVDIQAPAGTPVRVVAEGRVSVITWMRGFGNTIIIEHSKGFYTVYAHLSQIFVEKGDEILEGKTIGSVGEFGVPRQSILHFEIYGGKKLFNPEDWLDGKRRNRKKHRSE